jgi:hypothetical protein
MMLVTARNSEEVIMDTTSADLSENSGLLGLAPQDASVFVDRHIPGVDGSTSADRHPRVGDSIPPGLISILVLVIGAILAVCLL